MPVADVPPVPLRLSCDDPSHHTARDARQYGHLRVRRGAFLDLRDLHGPDWAIDQAVTLARIHAVGRTMTPNAVVMGWHAAVLHGLPVEVSEPEVSIATPVRPSVRSDHSGVRRFVRHLDTEEITQINGIPVTTLERTAIDCARSGDPVRGLAVVDAVLARLAQPDRRTSEASEQRLASTHERLVAILRSEPGRRGNTRAHTLLTWADGWAASPFESKARRLALVLGLPRPTAQRVVQARGRLYYTDLSWHFGSSFEWVLHLEVDGFGKYADATALGRERDRESDIRGLGHRLVRVERQILGARSAPDFARRLAPFLPPDVREAARARTELMTRWEQDHQAAFRLA